MTLLFTIAAALAGAVSGWLVPLDLFVATVNPLVVTYSIMGAAILVRMNRGMPTLDWKNLEQAERESLTGKIVALFREYLVILSVQALALVSLVTLGVLNSPTATTPSRLMSLPEFWQHVCGAFLGLLLALSFVRMGYIVWRDYDIVLLQKRLIDRTGRREDAAQNATIAAGKIASIKAAGLRSVPNPEPKGWND